jgi:hypothetical protein
VGKVAGIVLQKKRYFLLLTKLVLALTINNVLWYFV